MILNTNYETMTNTSSELSKPRKEIRDLLGGEAFKRQIALALPSNMDPARFVRIALTATHKNPKLLDCTQESFFNCLLQLGSWGLAPDNRAAHLVPFGRECTLIVDYKGICELLRRNGDILALHADVVGANDQFEIRFGTNAVLDHVPNLANRGEIIAAYSWVKLPNGGEEYDVMGVDEIQAVRRRSKTPDSGPWKTDFNEMAKKTVFRRHSKMLPLSPIVREVLDRDSDGDSLSETERFASATPVQASVLPEAPRKRGRPAKLEQIEEGLEAELGPAPETPQMAPERAQSPEPYPAPAATQTPTAEPIALHEQVLAQVVAAGFTEDEMISMLKKKRIITTEDASHTHSLKDVKPRGLQMCLDQWENAQILLEQQRSGKL